MPIAAPARSFRDISFMSAPPFAVCRPLLTPRRSMRVAQQIIRRRCHSRYRRRYQFRYGAHIATWSLLRLMLYSTMLFCRSFVFTPWISF